MAAGPSTLTRPRVLSTGSLGFVHLGLAYAYSQPALSVNPAIPVGGGRVSVVSYINALGPVWLVGFGITGALLIAALLLVPRLLAWAHVGGVLVSTVYSFALWAGFVLSTPRPTIIAAVLSVGIMMWHIGMSDLYSAGGVPRRRRHHA
ncbi:MAG: hypothetical protein H7Y15_05395 [Pseudonocardia sp.]|nr:hypothetical protein [Pseudonocardia sp.]